MESNWSSAVRALVKRRTVVPLNVLTLIRLGITLGVPLAQEVYQALRQDPVGDDGLPVGWSEIEAQIARGRTLAAEGVAVAERELGR